MTYLVDANVLSEPTKPSPDARVVDWLDVHEADFVVDSIVLGRFPTLRELEAASERRRFKS